MIESFHAYEISLTGPPRERGRIYGEELRPQILSAVAGYAASIQKGVNREVDGVFHEIVHESGFVAAVERWTPTLIEEVRGIAEAVGLPFETVMAWQFIQEMTWFPQEHAAAAVVAAGCTSLGAAPANGATIVAQTVDGTGWGHGRELIMHLDDPDTGIKAHVVGWPGMIGVYGLNDRGIGVCCNSMYFDVNHSTDGLPALFAVRGILAQKTFEDVDLFIRRVPHASGTNFMVGAPGHAVSYEVAAKQVTAFEPSPAATMTYHTNHCLANDDRADHGAPGWDASSRTRFESVQRRMQEAQGALSWDDAREIVSAHDDDAYPICRHYDGDEAIMTLFGLIMECAADPVMHVSSGPPCFTEFRSFGF